MFWPDLAPFGAKAYRVVSRNNAAYTVLDTRGSPADETLGYRLAQIGMRRSPDHEHYWYAGENFEPYQLSKAFGRLEEVPFVPREHLREIAARPESFADDESEAEGLDPGAAVPAPISDAIASPESETAGPKVGRASPADRLHVDVGNVAGFAIKELRGRGDKFLLQRVRELNDDQTNAYVRLSNIWPSLKYGAMAEAGAEPGAAYLIAQVRRHMPAAPGGKILGRKWAQYKIGADAYVWGATTVRDALKDVKTLDDAVEAIISLRENWTRQRTVGDTLYTRMAADMPGEFSANGEDTEVSAEGVCGIRGPVMDRNGAAMLRARAEGATDGNKTWAFLPRSNPLHPASEHYRERKAARDAHRGPAGAAKAGPRFVARPHLDHIVREGAKDYRQGRDVKGEDLIEAFGVSGVEYGNWQSQDERQRLLNYSFDALHDLADVLGIPARAISLGGRLGLAFGSRGRGGPRAAAAHFEPANFAINLTRMAGAGSLAHEWFHALDRAFSAAPIRGRDAPFASDWGVTRLGRIPAQALAMSPESKARFVDLIKTIMFAPPTDADVERVITADLRNAESVVAGMVLRIKEHMSHRLAQQEQDGAPDNATKIDAQKVIDLCNCAASGGRVEWTEWMGALSKEIGRDIPSILVPLADLTDKLALAQAVQRGELDSPQAAALDQQQRIAARDTAWDASRTSSTMLADARTLDGSTRKPYWALKIEMFARAGERAVQEELLSRGARNDFLVAISKSQVGVDGKSGRAYPEGEHLAAIGAALRAFVCGLEVKDGHSEEERAKRLPVMYSLDGSAITAGPTRGMLAHDLIHEVRGLIGHAADVDVRESLGEHAGHSVAGYYDHERRLIRLAGANPNAREAAHHEAWHAAEACGLMTPEELAIVTEAMRSGSRQRQELERAMIRDGKHHLMGQMQRDPAEARAFAYQYWSAGRLDGASETRMARVFARVRDFYDRVANLAFGYGFRSHVDVFAALADGSIRERAEHKTAAERPRATSVAGMAV